MSLPRMDRNTLYLVIGGLLLLCGVLGFLMFGRSKKNDVEKDSKGEDGPPEFIMFSHPDCPPCKTAKPEWEKFVESQGSPDHLRLVIVGTPESQNFAITGTPTFRYFPRGSANSKDFVDYKGPRTAEKLGEFFTEKTLL